MSKPLCIYHAPGCADGLLAAWAVHRALGDEVEFVAAQYGDAPPPSLAGRDILIVDFSYPLATLRAMAAEARSVLVLDHHATAGEDLKELPEPIPDRFDGLPFYIGIAGTGEQNLAAIFDMERSGCGIVWDYLHPNNTPRPRIIDLVEDYVRLHSCHS